MSDALQSLWFQFCNLVSDLTCVQTLSAFTLPERKCKKVPTNQPTHLPTFYPSLNLSRYLLPLPIFSLHTCSSRWLRLSHSWGEIYLPLDLHSKEFKMNRPSIYTPFSLLTLSLSHIVSPSYPFQKLATVAKSVPWFIFIIHWMISKVNFYFWNFLLLWTWDKAKPLCTAQCAGANN